jgi:flavorubredoxin
MNEWLAAAPSAQVFHGTLGCDVSIGDLADRPVHAMEDGQVLDLGGRRVRLLSTPHVPHGWEAGLLFEETTSTLFCGDLFTATGECAPTTDDDILGPALVAEEMFHATALTPQTGPTIRRLVDLDAETLALMHGPAFTGDTKEALLGLAAAYQSQLADALHASV